VFSVRREQALLDSPHDLEADPLSAR